MQYAFEVRFGLHACVFHSMRVRCVVVLVTLETCVGRHNQKETITIMHPWSTETSAGFRMWRRFLPDLRLDVLGNRSTHRASLSWITLRMMIERLTQPKLNSRSHLE